MIHCEPLIPNEIANAYVHSPRTVCLLKLTVVIFSPLEFWARRRCPREGVKVPRWRESQSALLVAYHTPAFAHPDSAALEVMARVAAGIGRVKGVKKLGVRMGNWLSAKEARELWQSPDTETLKGKRDRAIIAVRLDCSLRRRELADLCFIFSGVRIVGRLSISSVRVATFERFPFPTG